MKHLIKSALFTAALALGFALPPVHAEGRDGPPPGGKHHRGPDLALLKEKLSLTDAQVEQLKPIFAEERTKMEALRDKAGSKDEKRAEFEKIRDETKSKVDAVLTPEQRTKMEELRKNMKDRKGPPPADKGAE